MTLSPLTVTRLIRAEIRIQTVMTVPRCVKEGVSKPRKTVYPMPVMKHGEKSIPGRTATAPSLVDRTARLNEAENLKV
jgi:hypothetical protein